MAKRTSQEISRVAEYLTNYDNVKMSQAKMKARKLPESEFRYILEKERENYDFYYRTGGVAKSKVPGNKHIDVSKGFRLQHGYRAVKGADKTKNYAKGKAKLKVDKGWRLPKGYEVVDGAYNMKYEDGGKVEYETKYDLKGWRKSQNSWVVINKNPMSYSEATEMMNDARKSGLYDELSIESDILKREKGGGVATHYMDGQAMYRKGGVMGDIYSIQNAEQFKQLITTYNELSEKFGVVNYFLDHNDNSVVFLMHGDKESMSNTLKLQRYIDTLNDRGFGVFDKTKNKNIIIKKDNSQGGGYVYFKLKLSEIVRYAKGGALKSIPKGNKGLSKLPKEVRNRMGYMKDGGMTSGYCYEIGGL
jgi:hypothetical protein